MSKLAIVNKYGNVDLTKAKLSKRYTHVSGKRLQPLCRKLGIKYAEAVVGWTDGGRYGCKPQMDGVVVTAQSAPRLLDEIAARTKRNPPSKRPTNRKRLAKRKLQQEKQRLQRLKDAGIANPDSQVAAWFESGECDQFEALLIQFKAKYRHRHTNYDELLDELCAEVSDMSYGLDLDYWERQMAFKDARRVARDDKQEHDIPNTWDDYLKTYDFPANAVAKALAKVLQNPKDAHPIWFCEAVLAVKRAELPLNNLSFEKIVEAINEWREARN